MSKIEDTSFIEFVNSFDIVCLLETFLSEDILPLNVFSGFKKYFTPAIKISNLTKGRCSGGVIVLVKKEINKFVTELKNSFDNVIALKIAKDIGDLHNDLIILSAYIPPYGSPYYKLFNTKNGIHMFEQFATDLKSSYLNCSFILCGDFNSRTSCIQPISEINETDKYLNTEVFSAEDAKCFGRKSEDSQLNVFGRSFIEMCFCLDLFILNGSSKGDIDGSFTFMSPNGNSVVDYFLISDDLLGKDLELKVHSRVESWHMPISLVFSFRDDDREDTVKKVKYYEKIVWDPCKCQNVN